MQTNTDLCIGFRLDDTDLAQSGVVGFIVDFIVNYGDKSGLSLPGYKIIQSSTLD